MAISGLSLYRRFSIFIKYHLLRRVWISESHPTSRLTIDNQRNRKLQKPRLFLICPQPKHLFNPLCARVNSNTNQIYVTNLNSNNFSVISGLSNTVITTIPVGSGPFGAWVNPTTNQIYVANAVSNNVSVISGLSNTVITTIPVGTQPGGVVVNPNTNLIYVTNTVTNNVSVINGNTDTVIAPFQ